MNKMCFKITLSMMCCFFSPSFLQTSVAATKPQRSLPGTVLYFCYFISQITRVVSTELVSKYFLFLLLTFFGGVQDMACLSLVYPQAVK